MTQDEQQTLTIMMTEVGSKVQMLLDKQDELADNISKIKEAVYNPDQGLYARLTRLDARIETLEGWKNTNTKALWLMGSIAMGLVFTTVWQALF
tara:strand:+ start:392 stop:673 length:282 start_codon:yes stop_codon:yes gene_type:complete